MFKNLSLRTKLLACGGISVASKVVILVMVIFANEKISDVAELECVKLRSNDLDHILQGAVANCATQDQGSQQILDNALKVVRKAIADKGGLHVDPSAKVTWNAVNQFSHQAETVTLP